MNVLNRGILLISVFMLSCSLAGMAQEHDDLRAYQDDVQSFSVIYQGRQPIKYKMLYNGNPYWDLDGYQVGDLFFNGKLYHDVLMEIDACQQELLTRASEGVSPVGLGRDDISWFTRQGVRYANLSEEGIDVPQGFYQELYADGTRLYRRVDKILTSDTHSANGAPIGYDDPKYRSNVYDYFENKVCYYIIKSSGSVSCIKKKNQIYKVFPECRKELKRHLKASYTSVSTYELPAFFTEAVRFADSL